MRFTASLAVATATLAASTVASASVTIYSWENDTHSFSGITVQNTDPAGITHGTYSAEAATTATTNFYRGVYSASLADLLEGNQVLEVDFAVKDPDPVNTFRNVTFSIIIDAHDATTNALFNVELPAEQRIRAQAGTATIDYAALDPRLTNGGASDARISFRVGRQGGFTGSVYFDNLRVVPEPASLALAMLGGALAFVRRR